MYAEKELTTSKTAPTATELKGKTFSFQRISLPSNYLISSCINNLRRKVLYPRGLESN